MRKGFRDLKPFLLSLFASIGCRPRKVTFKSLLGRFNRFGALGSSGGATDHNTTTPRDNENTTTPSLNWEGGRGSPFPLSCLVILSLRRQEQP